ncbi:MAG: phosphatase PAP2 family protein [bacterium]|nr:phosphatase PAP2 family protein [bacterium]
MFRASLKDLPKNIVAVFKPEYLVWHVLMMAITFVIVQSGLDWRYFEWTRGELIRSFALPAAIIGFFVPIIVPVVMYIWGEIKKDNRLMTAGATIAQAEIVASIVAATYKAFTGRIQPEFYTYTSTLDISHNFNFGFFQHGIFWGWPSSHTAVAFAGAFALIALYPKNKFIKYLAFFYALYIGLGVSVSIHWLSDAVAGAILGILVSLTVVKNLAFLGK